MPCSIEAAMLADAPAAGLAEERREADADHEVEPPSEPEEQEP